MRVQARIAWEIFALTQMRSAGRRAVQFSAQAAGRSTEVLQQGSAHARCHAGSSVGLRTSGSADYLRRRCNAFRPNNVAEEPRPLAVLRCPFSAFPRHPIQRRPSGGLERPHGWRRPSDGNIRPRRPEKPLS